MTFARVFYCMASLNTAESSPVKQKHQQNSKAMLHIPERGSLQEECLNSNDPADHLTVYCAVGLGSYVPCHMCVTRVLPMLSHELAAC